MKLLIRCLVAVAASLTAEATADEWGGSLSEYGMHYGFGYGQEERPIEASTRDLNGNRFVINGQLVLEGSSLPAGMQLVGEDGSWLGSGMAIGNQLNVVTNGNNNTVIIDATQINNGDQTAIVRGE